MRGPVTFHLRLSGDRPYVLSANAGFSTSAAAALAMGYNEVDMALRSLVLKKPVRRPKLRKAVVIEMPGEVIIPGATFGGLAGGGEIGGKAARKRLIG